MTDLLTIFVRENINLWLEELLCNLHADFSGVFGMVNEFSFA